MIGSELHRYRDSACYVGADMEAEGLNLYVTRPFQISYAIADNKRIKSIHTSFIRWEGGLKLSADARRVTRFNDQLYNDTARPAKEVLAEFDAVLYDPGTELIGQNWIGYDLFIHRNWRRECGKPADWSYLTRALEMMALTKAVKLQLIPDVSSPEAFLAWQYRVHGHYQKGLKSSLESCARDEGIDHDLRGLHDAQSDIQLMMKLFWRRLYQLEF